MLMRVQRVSLLAVALVMLGALVGFVAGVGLWESAWRTESGVRGFAQYNSTTGAWEWRKDLRQPLHDQHGWEKCPVCNGQGEFFIDFEIEVEPAGVDRKNPLTWFDPCAPVEEM